ncbi:MAG TPA: hypothetical protein VFL45_04000 [Gammaproteobacteria bacterium]|jgi:hypothetical protein|nr:hypothetical protein [Gammaproteobacteria bacterium]
MSLSVSEPRIELTLQPRREWLWFLVVVHAVAFFALFAAELGTIVRVLLTAAIVVSLSRQLATHWRRSTPRAIRSIVWHTDGRWEVTDGRGTMIGVLDDYYLGSHLVILKFRHHPAVLLRGSGAIAPAMRRLRVRLRHGRVGMPGLSPQRYGHPSRASL